MSGTERRCDGVMRREVLRAGALTALGIGLGDLALARAAVAAGGPQPRARGCILVWLDGGPSHLDTFDPKPDAPIEVRGPFAAIDTEVPGIRFSELLPRLARQAGRLAVVRSMTSTLGEHDFGSHYLLTGYRPGPALVYPSLGAVTSLCRGGDPVLPHHINVGDAPNGKSGAGYLDAAHAPFVLGGDPSRPDFRVRDLDPPAALRRGRLERRRDLVAALDGLSALVDAAPDLAAAPRFEPAFRLATSAGARGAFDLGQETPATRARYGGRTLGQSCLLARRLIERGVPFVTVTDRGWDTHESIVTRLKEGYTGGAVGKAIILDQALSALLDDLAARGLLDETLVLVMGEFGRTPKINTSAGRDHWPRAFSVALAGGGVPGGQIIGESDAHGEGPRRRPVSPSDLARTVFRLLGIDPDRELRTADGRPVRINAGGEEIRELVG